MIKKNSYKALNKNYQYIKTEAGLEPGDAPDKFTIFNLKTKTKPDVVDVNNRIYSKEEYNKMINSDTTQSLLKDNALFFTIYDYTNDTHEFELINPINVIGTVCKIYDDSIDIKMRTNSSHLELIQDLKCSAGMRLLAEVRYDEDKKCTIVYNMKLICFDLIRE